MKSFEAGYLERQPITHNLLRGSGVLREFKGRAMLFAAQHPQALETLRQVALIQSTESSNRIEGVTAPLQRIQALVAQKTTPRDRSEQEILGYRDVLNTIHTSYAGIPLTPNVILQLHADLFRHTGTGGRWKSTEKDIVEIYPDGTRVVRFKPVPAYRTPEFMQRLHEQFNVLWQADEVDKLLLIPAYVLDFLCIHPFLDGNGRMARLLTLLLLYQAGFEVGRFISLEHIIERSKESYYDTLYRSSQDWHEGRHTLLPVTEYFFGVLTAAYNDFEERVGMLTAARGAKTEMVLNAIQHLPPEFRMTDIERICPNVTREMIRVVLNRLKREGKVEGIGWGAGAVWRKRRDDQE